MKELKTKFGYCKVKNDKFMVDEEIYAEDVSEFSPRIYKNEVYIFLRKKNLQYHVFAVKRKQFITRIFDQLAYETKRIIVAISGSEKKQKYYLYDLENPHNNRTIKGFAHTYVLEKDGLTLTNITKRALAINDKGVQMPLPKTCNALCTSTFAFPYCYTEDNKVLFLAPYPYNEVITSNPVFWELTSFVKPIKLKNWEANRLIHCLNFDSEEQKKLFCLVGFLFISRGSGKTIYQDNIDTVLSSKQISFIMQSYKITLTLDEILIENLSTLEFDRFAYSVFDFSSTYLDNLLCYIRHKNQIALIDGYVKEKIVLDEILKNTPVVLLREILYALNSHPTNDYFYVISSRKCLIKVNRESFVGKIVQGVLSGKNFRAVLKYYNLNDTIILPLIKTYCKNEYLENKRKFL